MTRWNEEKSTYYHRFGGEPGLEWFHARDIISDLYLKGYIDWSVFQKALARIKTVANGSWMFEKPALHIQGDISPPR